MFNFKESLTHRYFVGSGSVLTDPTKSTADLVPLQVGLFNAKTYKAIAAGTDGVDVREIIIAIGSPNVEKIGWTNAGHSMKTVPINSGKLISYRVSTPVRAKQHKVAIGYNGVTDCDTMSIKCGETKSIFIQVEGSPAARFYDGTPVKREFFYTAPCCSVDNPTAEADAEAMVNSFIQQINNDDIISPFVKAAKLVNYGTPPSPTTVEYTEYTLTVADAGGIEDLAAVQAQYPGATIIRKSRAGIYSTYQVILIGTDPTPDDFVVGALTLPADCTDCPSGYTLDSAHKYKFKIERSDLGNASALSTVKSDYSAELDQDTIVRVSYVNGTSTYIGKGSSASTPLTQGTTSGDVTTLIGTYAALCTNDETTVVAWVEGDTYFKIKRELCLTIGDQPCDDSSNTAQLADIVAFYAAAGGIDNIALDVNGTCANQYTADQLSSNLMIEQECSTDIAEFKEPDTYKGYHWTVCPCTSPTVEKVDNIGITLTGAYVSSEFGDCSFEIDDFVELDLVRIIARQGTRLDEIGKCNDAWAVTELQAPVYPTGTGENVKRNYIESMTFLHQFWSKTPRDREIYGYNYDFIKRKSYYKTYYLEFEALDKTAHNVGMDIRTTVAISFEEGVNTDAFENVLEGWISGTRPDLISDDHKYNAYRF